MALQSLPFLSFYSLICGRFPRTGRYARVQNHEGDDADESASSSAEVHAQTARRRTGTLLLCCLSFVVCRCKHMCCVLQAPYLPLPVPLYTAPYPPSPLTSCTTPYPPSPSTPPAHARNRQPGPGESRRSTGAQISRGSKRL